MVKKEKGFNWSKKTYSQRYSLAQESGLDVPSKVAMKGIGALTPRELSAIKNSIRLRRLRRK